MRRPRHPLTTAFDALTVEGALIAPAMMTRIAARTAPQQAEADYGIHKGLNLRDEVARFFRIGQALHADLKASPTPSLAATTSFVEALLREVFEIPDLRRVGRRERDGRTYPVILEGLGGRLPVVVVPPTDPLDKASPSLAFDGRRRSAASAVQDWLNADPDSLWGLCCNGDRLRLLRDNDSLTRPAFIEADLARMFEADAFADFSALWLLLHASRFGKAGTLPTDCPLERWREAGAREGAAARERLSDGVEAALQVLGSGFLADNPDLRQRVKDGALPRTEFFGQVLRLVYRLIFLLVAEDRGLLHPPEAPALARRLYAEGYSVSRLRDRAVRRAARDSHPDLWQGLRVVFMALARGEPRLGLPALGGLFTPDVMPDLETARLSNRALMRAMHHLAWLREGEGLVPVNWRDMETEELGSVYESLLELNPLLAEDGRALVFAAGSESKGHARKTTSSYYTPDSLVQTLLDSALDPVVARVESEAADPVAALLKVSVLDPACGSGHFLLAIARRLATRIARHRAGGVASAEEYRHALRDVARSCLYGVDRNPMAIELAKVALWIETVEPGKPLGFLDANLRCGDSLVGVFDYEILKSGIPDEAYKPLDGDDKDVAKVWSKFNKEQRDGKAATGFLADLKPPATLIEAAKKFSEMPEDTLEEIEAKRRMFAQLHSGDSWMDLKISCDLFVAAFFLPKTGEKPEARGLGTAMIPLTETVWRATRGQRPYSPLIAQADQIAHTVRAFHWPLEFPEVFARGGFDAVIGNPPWDTLSPDAKEFFSPYDEAVRSMAKPEQEARFEELRRIPGVDEAWLAYCRHIYATAAFIKYSGRFKLFAEGNLGKGDFNIYRMFVELALAAINRYGRAAQFVPENLYNGANATAIRKHLYHQMQLDAVVAFENTGKVWFDIDSRAKFCLYVANRNGPTQSFPCAFGVNSKEKLTALALGFPIDMPVSLIEEFSPEAMAIAEVAHPFDIAVSKKIYARFPKFGAEIIGAAKRIYMAEVHMGNDRDLFIEDPEAIPVYEGRMVEAYDHRAKAYVSGRARQAVWDDLSFGSERKKILPQWRIRRGGVPRKLNGRWDMVRVGFCDVASPTNQRALMAALIPANVICGDKVPTLTFDPPSEPLMLYWLGIANSFASDFVARKKVALKMSYTVLDSLPLPRQFTGTTVEFEIAKRALRLAATGPEMCDFWTATAPQLGLDPVRDSPTEDPQERRALRTEIDVLVARDVFQLTLDEMRYVLDPSDILGEDCGFETFGALKRAEEREFNNKFLSRDMIVEAWRILPTPLSAPPPFPDLATQSDNAWARPDGLSDEDIVLFAMVDVMRRFNAPTPWERVHMAVTLARRPALAGPFLDVLKRSDWQRVVGAEAEPLPANIVTLAQFQQNRLDHAWAAVENRLLGTGVLVVHADTGLWEASATLPPSSGEPWMEGRAAWAVELLKAVDTAAATQNIVSFIRSVENADAARTVS